MSKSGRRHRSLNLTPKRLSASMDSTLLADEDFRDRILFLAESDAGITLAVEGAGDGGTGGALAELDAEQARQLADALNDAADEIGAEG